VSDGLLTFSSQSELCVDEYDARRSRFNRELQAYLIDRNAGLPPERLKSIAMLSSGKANAIYGTACDKSASS
jgi:hypothetical protein